MPGRMPDRRLGVDLLPGSWVPAALPKPAEAQSGCRPHGPRRVITCVAARTSEPTQLPTHGSVVSATSARLPLKTPFDRGEPGEPLLASIEMRAIPHWQTWLRDYGRITLSSRRNPGCWVSPHLLSAVVSAPPGTTAIVVWPDHSGLTSTSAPAGASPATTSSSRDQAGRSPAHPGRRLRPPSRATASGRRVQPRNGRVRKRPASATPSAGARRSARPDRR